MENPVIYFQGIDNTEVIGAVHTRRPPTDARQRGPAAIAGRLLIAQRSSNRSLTARSRRRELRSLSAIKPSTDTLIE